MDSRLRGNDINCSFAVIPAKAGIHTAYPDTNAGRRAVAPNVAIDDDGFSPPPTVGPYRSLPGTGVRRQEGGAPDRIRTCDLWLRRPTLYPTELRAPGWCAPARTTPAFAARRAGGNARASSMGQAVRGNPHAVRLDDGTVVDRAAGGQADFRPGSNSHFVSPQASRSDRRTQPLGARASCPLEHTGGPSAHMRAGRPRSQGGSDALDVSSCAKTRIAAAPGGSSSTRGATSKVHNPRYALVPDRGLLQPYPGLPHNDSGGLREQG